MEKGKHGLFPFMRQGVQTVPSISGGLPFTGRNTVKLIELPAGAYWPVVQP